MPYSSEPLELADGVAQGRAFAGGAAELGRQLHQEVFLRGDIAARGGDLVRYQVGKGEVLQHRDAIGKAFVKGLDIAIAWQEKAAVHAVKQGVCGFMGDNVMR